MRLRWMLAGTARATGPLGATTGSRPFAHDVLAVIRPRDAPPVLVGASLGGLAALLLEGEIAPGT